MVLRLSFLMIFFAVSFVIRVSLFHSLRLHLSPREVLLPLIALFSCIASKFLLFHIAFKRLALAFSLLNFLTIDIHLLVLGELSA